MPRVDLIDLKDPLDATDKLLGSDVSGELINVDVDSLKTYIEAGTATPFIDVVTSGDDTGLIFTEQISVGTPAAPRESVFGGGDSYPVPIAYHCTIANTTGAIITSATDVTEILGSDSLSTVGLFNGVVTGNYLLVGSDYTFGGVKAKIDTLATVEAGNISGEYLSEIGVWTTASFMATDSDYPYEHKGNQIATCSSCSEQWRFGFNPLDLPTPWDQVELTINGTPSTKYWARFRITSDITSDPIIQQIKLHTNRFEINADGFTEYFGRTRYPRNVYVSIEPNALKSPSDRNIPISTGISIQRANNRFSNSAIDGLLTVGRVEQGVDTSIPITILVDWYAEGSLTGNVELEMEVVPVVGEFVYDGTATSFPLSPVVTAINNEEGVRKTSIFQSLINVSAPGDTIVGSIFRDATPANTTDTYAGNIVITNVRVIAYFWKP